MAVEGAPPAPYPQIRRRLEVAQAASGAETVDHIFDLPLELAESLCGYHPGGAAGLEWTSLRRRQPTAASSAVPRQSLRAAMKAELIPLLTSLGWELASSRPNLAEPDEIVRLAGDLTQTIWFDFKQGDGTYIVVNFAAHGGDAASAGYAVLGRVRAPAVPVPLWKRFTFKRLWQLTRTPPPPADLIGSVVESAGDDIRTADAFLRTGEAGASICLDRSRSRGAWPPA